MSKTPITADEIEAARSPAGGFTAAILKQWGVGWPPPKGWRDTIIEYGYPYDETLNPTANRGGDAEAVLKAVLLAVVDAGQAHILWEIPEALAYTGSRIPTPEELSALHNVDPRLLEVSKLIHEGC